MARSRLLRVRPTLANYVRLDWAFGIRLVANAKMVRTSNLFQITAARKAILEVLLHVQHVFQLVDVRHRFSECCLYGRDQFVKGTSIVSVQVPGQTAEELVNSFMGMPAEQKRVNGSSRAGKQL